MTDKPWSVMDPNTQHQLWSEWVFTIFENGRHAPYVDVRDNALRWLRQGFGSMGQAKIEEKVTSVTGRNKALTQRTYVITARVEGVPAHDPTYVEHVRMQFQNNFVQKGWGSLATSTVTARVLAGDKQDGAPRDQLIVMPPLRVM